MAKCPLTQAQAEYFTTTIALALRADLFQTSLLGRINIATNALTTHVKMWEYKQETGEGEAYPDDPSEEVIEIILDHPLDWV